MRFVEKISTQQDSEFYIVRANDIGNRKAIYLLKLDTKMRENFLALKPDEPADLNDYGKVIHSEFGGNISEQTKKSLMLKYNIIFGG